MKSTPFKMLGMCEDDKILMCNYLLAQCNSLSTLSLSSSFLQLIPPYCFTSTDYFSCGVAFWEYLSMAIAAAAVIVPLGVLFFISGLVINLIQVILDSQYFDFRIFSFSIWFVITIFEYAGFILLFGIAIGVFSFLFFWDICLLAAFLWCILIWNWWS